jgi:hypothetical protein
VGGPSLAEVEPRVMARTRLRDVHRSSDEMAGPASVAWTISGSIRLFAPDSNHRVFECSSHVKRNPQLDRTVQVRGFGSVGPRPFSLTVSGHNDLFILYVANAATLSCSRRRGAPAFISDLGKNAMALATLTDDV